MPAGGTGKTGYFEAFTFTNTTIKLNAIFCENGAALFRVWRDKGNIWHVASTVLKFVEAILCDRYKP